MGRLTVDLAALKRSQESPAAAREYMLNQGENARDFGAHTSRAGEASSRQAARTARVDRIRQAAQAR